MLDALRTWLNNNSAVATVLVVAVLLGALASLVLRGRSPRARPTQVYYFDVTTSRLFTASSADLPPITSPDGHEAVRAHFFACGPCSREKRFLGYYEKYSDETRKALAQRRDALMFNPGPIPGHLYSLDAQAWHEEASPEAQAILNGIYSRCTDPQPCLPEDEVD
jgi:hypothetical protein